MLDSTFWIIKVMACNGMYAKTIRKQLFKMTGTRLTDAQIYYACRKAGIKLSDYRRGIGREAEIVIGKAHKYRGSRRLRKAG